MDAAISADGKFVAFLSDRAGPFDAWVGQVGGGEFLNLTKGQFPELRGDPVRNVGFSDDGAHVWLRISMSAARGAQQARRSRQGMAGSDDRWSAASLSAERRRGGLVSGPQPDRLLRHQPRGSDLHRRSQRRQPEADLQGSSRASTITTSLVSGRPLHLLRAGTAAKRFRGHLADPLGGGTAERLTHHNSRVGLSHAARRPHPDLLGHTGRRLGLRTLGDGRRATDSACGDLRPRGVHVRRGERGRPASRRDGGQSRPQPLDRADLGSHPRRLRLPHG